MMSIIPFLILSYPLRDGWTTDLSPGREPELLLHDVYNIVQGPLSIAEELRNCLLVRIPTQRHVRSGMEITVDAVQ
jgi:hypothetical protein